MNLWQQLLKRWQLRFRPNSLKGFLSFFLVGTLLSVSLAACSGTNNSNTGGETGGKKQKVEITLVSFAVTKAAHEQLFPNLWKNGKRNIIKLWNLNKAMVVPVHKPAL